MPSLLENFAAMSGGGMGAAPIDLLAPPVDDPSLLSRIGGSALSGLGWLGEVLQKPDRILYAIPSGNPRELLNLVPFSDAMGLTDPSNMADASTALENFGIIPENQEGFDAWDIPRFFINVGGSPSTYLSLGGAAASKAGQIAKGLNVFGDLSRVQRIATPLRKFINPENVGNAEEIAKSIGTTLDDVIDQRLSGGFRLGLPFTNIGRTFGTGKVSQTIAGAMDKTGKILPELPVVGDAYRFGRMLFDPSAGNRLLPREQELSELAYRLKPAEEAAANAARYNSVVAIDRAYKSFDEAFGEGIRENLTLPTEIAEGSAAATEFGTRATRNVLDKIARMTGETDDLGAAWERFMGAGAAKPSRELADQITIIGRDMAHANRSVRDELYDLGVEINLLPELDNFAHQARFVGEKLADDMSKLRPQRLARTSTSSAKARTKAIKLVPAAMVDDLLVDPAARGDDLAVTAAHILSKYGKWLGKGDLYEGGAVEHATDLAKWVSEHAQAPLFTRRFVDDFSDYQKYGHLAIANTKAVHEMAIRNMGATEGVRLSKALRRAGMSPKRAMTKIAQSQGKTLKQIKNTKIPQDVADAMVAAIRPWQDREWAELLGKTIGKVNGWFRKNVTLPFLSFAARNFGSGQHVNIAASGVIKTPSDLAQYARAFKESVNALRHPEANTELIRELWEQGLTGSRIGRGFEDVETFIEGASDALTPKSPFGVKTTFGEVAANAEAAPLPFGLERRVPGLASARRGYGTWMGTGAKLNQNVEFLNRVPMYRYLRKRGWLPAAAKKKVDELQFDYGDITQAERAIRNSAIPFYTFSRKVGPLILRNLLERPGGGVAQTIRATNAARGDRASSATTPDYIASGTSIPLGQSEDGTQRYLTGLGLAHEVPVQYLGGGVRGAGLELLSQLSPVVKAPLEWITGQSFFQRGPGGGGRPLEELDPTIGRTIANLGEVLSGERQQEIGEPGFVEFMLSNSPVSRYLTTARQFSDPRKSLLDKGILAATGLRFTDVSPAAQDAVLRERAGEIMKELGAETFEKIYFPKDELATMEDDRREAATKLTALQTMMARRSKARKKAREAAGTTKR